MTQYFFSVNIQFCVSYFLLFNVRWYSKLKEKFRKSTSLCKLCSTFCEVLFEKKFYRRGDFCGDPN